MFDTSTQSIIVFILTSLLLILFLVAFIAGIIYRYQKKQHSYYRKLEEMKIAHQEAVLQSELEMQEQTFQNLSREIHDNIGQKLTLTKLYLNTIDLSDKVQTLDHVENSVGLVSEVISELSNISSSLSSEIILNNGLIKGIQCEAAQVERSGLYNVSLAVTGDTVFLEARVELILFRILQEAIHNILKHAFAQYIGIQLHYSKTRLKMVVTDNGKGFLKNDPSRRGIGLLNIEKRTAILKGRCSIKSYIDIGTIIKIEIPFYVNETSLPGSIGR